MLSFDLYVCPPDGTTDPLDIGQSVYETLVQAWIYRGSAGVSQDDLLIFQVRRGPGACRLCTRE